MTIFSSLLAERARQLMTVTAGVYGTMYSDLIAMVSSTILILGYNYYKCKCEGRENACKFVEVAENELVIPIATPITYEVGVTYSDLKHAIGFDLLSTDVGVECFKCRKRLLEASLLEACKKLISAILEIENHLLPYRIALLDADDQMKRHLSDKFIEFQEWFAQKLKIVPLCTECLSFDVATPFVGGSLAALGTIVSSYVGLVYMYVLMGQSAEYRMRNFMYIACECEPRSPKKILERAISLFPEEEREAISYISRNLVPTAIRSFKLS